MAGCDNRWLWPPVRSGNCPRHARPGRRLRAGSWCAGQRRIGAGHGPSGQRRDHAGRWRRHAAKSARQPPSQGFPAGQQRQAYRPEGRQARPVHRAHQFKGKARRIAMADKNDLRRLQTQPPRLVPQRPVKSAQEIPVRMKFGPGDQEMSMGHRIAPALRLAQDMPSYRPRGRRGRHRSHLALAFSFRQRIVCISSCTE